MDNSLLIYTMDNALLFYLVVPTAETIKLHPTGSISFDGVGVTYDVILTVPFRLLELGDPADDLAVATVLIMVGGEWVLLDPRRLTSLICMIFRLTG